MFVIKRLQLFGKRSILLSILFLFFFQAVYSQQWVKTFSNGMMPEVNCLIELYDKGYLFIDNYANSMTWLIKTDINGLPLWNKKIGDAQHVFYSLNIESTADGGFILGGSMAKYDPTGYSDPFLMKLNSCGEMEWCKVISTPGNYDYADCVRQTNEGQYVLLTSYSDVDQNKRIQLFKFNSSGDLLWKQNYLPPSSAFNDDGRDLLILNDGYLITGECYYPDSDKQGGYERPYFIKTDSTGIFIWKTIYGSINGFHGFSGVYSTIRSGSGDYYNVALHSNYCDTPALIKCLGSGNESYYKDLYPATCPGGTSPINFISDTNLVVFIGGIINNERHMKWMKTDTLGNGIYEKPFTDTWMTKTNCSIITFDKKIVSLSCSGLTMYLYKLNQGFDYDSIYTRPFTYDSLCPHPIVSDTINPNCGIIVNVNEPNTNPETTQLRVFPNPAKHKVVVDFPKYLVISSGYGDNTSQTTFNQWGYTSLEVYNLNGEQIFKQEIPKDQTHLEMDLSTWPKGMYYFRLIYNKQTIAGEKLIVE